MGQPQNAAGAAVEPESTLLVNRRNMPHEIDGGLAARARLGLVILSSDHTVEYEFHKILQELPGVAVYGARIRNSPNITPETLADMEGRIAQTTDLILPGMPLDSVAYGCTSASMVIGEERVSELIRTARPGVPATNPVTAARAAFAALGMRRIALLTPYSDEINQRMRGYFEACGLGVPVMGSFNEEDDNVAARVSLASIRDAALELGQEDSVDGVFVSCTSLRLIEVVSEIEEALGKPVTSSNHALAWHSLRLAGIDDTVPSQGKLFRESGV